MKDGFERGVTAEDLVSDDAENTPELEYMALEERIILVRPFLQYKQHRQ